ncbi:hypothetical protein [Ruegeria arenilitoris]|uniref:hypothetical protein n=1 Tax=Ruegeria arenilitoris TaxID=1173585 RepID=UPI0014801D63|nr:hypothetical protein [Ruegeria arenilitoris]
MTADAPLTTHPIDQQNKQLQVDVAKFINILSDLLLQLQADVDDPNTSALNPTLIKFGDILINTRFSGKEFLRNLNKLSEMRENAR